MTEQLAWAAADGIRYLDPEARLDAADRLRRQTGSRHAVRLWVQ